MVEPGLVELATAEEENAKRLLFKRLPLCHVAAACLTIGALFSPLPQAYFLGIGVLVLEALALHLRRQALAMHRRADQARRRALLINAFGSSAERLDVADLRKSFSNWACKKAAELDRSDYWAERGGALSGVLSNLQESAFWSKHLYKAAAKRMGLIAGVVVVCLFAIAVWGFLVFDGDTELAVARVLVVALSLLIGLDLIGQALAWSGAASEAEAVDRRLEHMDGTLEEPLLAVIGDYAIATSTAPPIPDHFYQRDKDKLDGLWAARQGSD
jgi:hypothetical protein